MIESRILPSCETIPICQDIKEIISQLKNKGLTLHQIANQINSNYEKVRQIALKEGIIKSRSIAKRLSAGKKLSFRAIYLSWRFKNKEIAKIFGISIASVKRLAKRMKLPSKYSNNYPYRVERRRKVLELYRKKKSTEEIGKELKVNAETVRNDLIHMGVKRRYVNGLTKNKITRQNKIIKKLYLKGKKLKDIEKATGIGKHGIDKRLKAMNIARNRNPFSRIGNKYDIDIRKNFLDGKNINQIAGELGLTQSAVAYRLKKYIFLYSKFKLAYCSKLSSRWKKSLKTYPTLKEIDMAKRRTRKYISKNVQFKIIPIQPRFIFKENSIYEQKTTEVVT